MAHTSAIQAIVVAQNALEEKRDRLGGEIDELSKALNNLHEERGHIVDEIDKLEKAIDLLNKHGSSVARAT